MTLQSQTWSCLRLSGNHRDILVCQKADTQRICFKQENPHRNGLLRINPTWSWNLGALTTPVVLLTWNSPKSLLLSAKAYIYQCTAFGLYFCIIQSQVMVLLLWGSWNKTLVYLAKMIVYKTVFPAVFHKQRIHKCISRRISALHGRHSLSISAGLSDSDLISRSQSGLTKRREETHKDKMHWNQSELVDLATAD